MSLHRSLFAVFCLLAASVAGFHSVKADEGVDAIRTLMMATFDKPEERLSVDPVTIEGDIAVAGWVQGERGGRALLRRSNGQWKIVLCGGDGLRESALYEQIGLSTDEAKQIVGRVKEAEEKMDAERVRKFSMFDGVVMMDGEGDHPAVHEPENHKGH